MQALLLDAITQSSKSAYALIKLDDLSVTYLSPSFDQLFGIQGQRFRDDIYLLVEFMDEEAGRSLRQQLAQWDRSQRLDVDVRFPSSHVHDQQAIRFSFDLVQGGTFVMARARNIDEELAAAQAQAAELAELRDQATGKSEFLNKMSHEIRTPLNGISGLLELIQGHYEEGADIHDDVSRARQLSSYMLSLVNDILDMSRIDAGKVELESARMDLKELAFEWQSMFDGLARDRKLRYEVQLDGCDVRYVMGDRMRLSQIVVNFISNALKFTDEGGSVRVVVRQMYRRQDNVHLLFRVSDTGKGIEPEFLGKIFRPFEQENLSIARTYGGSGLGMAIADSLTRLMGGHIMVESTVGKGSDFGLYLTLPVAPGAQDMDAPVATQQPRQQQERKPLDLSGSVMLLAEDNDVNAMITTHQMKAQNVQLDRAVDGIQVQEMLQASQPGHYAAILMDIQMPRCDGWEAARAIRAMDRPDAKAIPIIALSANAYIEDMRKSAAAGMDGHVAKPVDYGQLLSVLRTVIEEHAHQAER